jgi:hypothetical protein
MTPLQTDIYRTLSYFSYFGYPLTVFELWKYLYQPSQAWTFREVAEAVGADPGIGPLRIEGYNGFYGLPDETHGSVRRQVGVRHDRYLDAIRKYRRLRWMRWYLRCLPFVRGVAVCNTLALHHTKPESDIDLFVVARPGRVWTVRFLAVLPLMLFRLRPREAKHDPVDVSFIVSERAMNFEALRIKPDDPYFSFWLATLRPVLDRGDIFNRLAAANISSLIDLPNIGQHQKMADRPKSVFDEPKQSLTEKWLEKIQRLKFPDEITELQNRDNCVVVTDDILKFHKNDRRLEIRDYLETKMKLCASS